MATFRGMLKSLIRTPESWFEQTFSSLPSRRLVLQLCTGLVFNLTLRWVVLGRGWLSGAESQMVQSWTPQPFTALPTLYKSWPPVLKAEL